MIPGVRGQKSILVESYITCDSARGIQERNDCEKQNCGFSLLK